MSSIPHSSPTEFSICIWAKKLFNGVCRALALLSGGTLMHRSEFRLYQEGLLLFVSIVLGVVFTTLIATALKLDAISWSSFFVFVMCSALVRGIIWHGERSDERPPDDEPEPHC